MKLEYKERGRKMKKRIIYKWTANYDETQQNNNFSCGRELIELGDDECDFSFGEYLTDCSELQFEQENNTYYILNNDGNRTGEAYLVLSDGSEVVDVCGIGKMVATKINDSCTTDDGVVYDELAIASDGKLLAYDNGVNGWVMLWGDASEFGFYIDN